MMTKNSIIVAITFTFSFLIPSKTSASYKKIQVLWDEYGVPHVYSKSNNDMYYAFGWAQMRNHADLLLRLYGQARGRAAEYWGEKYLESDKQVHTFNLPETAQRNYTLNDHRQKDYLNAFVAGINSYANENRDKIDDEVEIVLPIKVTDVLAHMSRVVSLKFLAAADISPLNQDLSPGSNALAISSRKSASGNSILMSNPHLPWEDLFILFEAHLNSPTFHAYGVALIGQPVLNIAFNKHLGWTHTVNTIDASDRYRLTTDKQNYLLDGEIVKYSTKNIQLTISDKNGSYKKLDFSVKSSVHGPIMFTSKNQVVAVRIAGIDNPFISKQYHLMAGAKNLSQFTKAIRMLQIPMFNIIYADKNKNIMYLFGGNVPVRSEGDWMFWQKEIDGSQSKLIWDKTHTFEELPKVVNPITGFVQNCNDSPWYCTYPMMLRPKDYPSYMSPEIMDLRAQRAVNLIKDHDKVSVKDVINYKFNTGLESADRFLDDLFAAFHQYPDTNAVTAIEILKNWNRSTDIDSKGAVLFLTWFDKLPKSIFKYKWDSKNPVNTPDGLADQRLAIELLIKAYKQVKDKYGSANIPYGEVNRVKYGDINLPANGGPGKFGILRTMYFKESPSRQNYVVYGDSYVAITEFGSRPKAQVSLSYGNATQSGNRHVGDQLQLVSEKKLRPALLTKSELANHVEFIEEIRRKKQPDSE
jgi:acyl-homoserine-lactone acylase